MMLVAWQFPCRGHRSFFRQLQVIGSVPVPLVEICLLCDLMMLAMLGSVPVEYLIQFGFQSTVINMYANVYIRVTIQKLHQLSDDRITRETLSNNNPCPSSPSSTI